MGNWLKTTLLLGLLTALIVWIGNLLGGRQGMVIAFILAIGMNFFSYWFSHKIVLMMYHAKELTPPEAPQLYEMVSRLTQRANLPMPRLFLIPEDSPNAFATGRNPNNAVVAVTEGLLKLMGREEIEGVLSHELAHIKNRDILIGSIAATLAGAIMILANTARWGAFFGGGSSENEEGRGIGTLGVIILSILAPLAAMLIQMAISRSREYHADTTGAGFAGQPYGLASALEKLGTYTRRLPLPATPNTAHMFIVNPLSAGTFASLFSTHPPLEERISRLKGQRPSMSTPSGEEKGLKEAAETWRNLSR